MIRTVLLVFLALAFVGCHFDSPIFTPADDDTAYPCRDEQGKRTAKAFSCVPYDGVPGCCWEGQQCEPGGCAATALPFGNIGAARPTARLLEQP